MREKERKGEKRSWISVGGGNGGVGALLELVPSGKQRNRVRVENGRRIRTVHDAHTPPVVASLSFNQVAVCRAARCSTAVNIVQVVGKHAISSPTKRQINPADEKPRNQFSEKKRVNLVPWLFQCNRPLTLT